MVLPSGLEIPTGQIAEICRRYSVKELSVCGSAARGDFRPDSDVDFLVNFLPNTSIGLIELTGLMLDLEKVLGRKVDLLEPDALKERVRESTRRDAHAVYAA